MLNQQDCLFSPSRSIPEQICGAGLGWGAKKKNVENNLKPPGVTGIVLKPCGRMCFFHESAMRVHVFPILTLPPPSPTHPSGSSQCTSPEHPVSCIEPRLAIYFTYGNIHVSMLFSQIIPSSPLPQSPKDCSIHLCLFCCLAYRVIITIFLNSIYMH